MPAHSFLRLGCSGVLAVSLLVACATPPPARDPGTAGAALVFPDAWYRDPPQAGQVYAIDARASRVQVLVFRAGAAASQGHNHLLLAPLAAGAVFVPARGLEGARADLLFTSAELEVDPAAARAAAGAPFADAVPERARAGTRANLLGPAVLDAGRFPQIGVQVAVAGGEFPHVVVEATLTVKGHVHTVQVPVQVERDHDALRVRGTLPLRQRELGLQAFSALGGLLRVAEVLIVQFDLVAVAVADGP